MKKTAWLIAGALGISIGCHAQVPTGDGRKPPSKVGGEKVEPGKRPPAKSSGTCEQRVCQVAVTASSCQTVDVKPDELKLKGRKDYEIVWTIPAGSPATFRDKGIFFKDTNSSPLEALGIKRGVRIGKDGKEVRLTISPAKGRWYYGVQVAYAGRNCADYDPVIVNEM
jgi:hypothetical protein